MKLSRTWKAKVPRKRLTQYFGAWAIEASALQQMVAGVSRINPAKHFAEEDWDEAGIDAPEASLGPDGVATLCIRGTITKYGSSLSDAGSASRMRRLVRQWTEDDRVLGMFLVIDSPGGTVAGTGDLADAVAEFAKAKPCVAYCEDLTASAAYWVASQAREVYANPTALVGSIGAFACLMDSSEAHAREGLEVHVVRSAPGKGRGTPGTKVDEETLGEMQHIIDAVHDQFVSAVAVGRDFDPKVVREEWADGTCYPAGEAETLGLIDGVLTLEEARGRVLNSSTAGAQPTAPQGTQAVPKKFARTTAKSKPVAKVRRGRANASATSSRRRARAEEPTEEAEGEEDDTVAEGEEEEPAAEGEEDPNAEDDEEPTAEGEEEEKPAARRGRASASGRRPAVATIAQLKAACPRSDAGFRERCIEAGLSLAQAKDRYIRALEARVDSAPSQGSRPRGVQPLGSQRPAAGQRHADPKAAWEEEIQKRVARGMTHNAARAALVKERPDLQQALVAAANAGR